MGLTVSETPLLGFKEATVNARALPVYTAVTALFALIVTLQVVPDAVSQPVQLLKLFPPTVAGAVSVTAVLLL